MGSLWTNWSHEKDQKRGNLKTSINQHPKSWRASPRNRDAGANYLGQEWEGSSQTGVWCKGFTGGSPQGQALGLGTVYVGWQDLGVPTVEGTGVHAVRWSLTSFIHLGSSLSKPDWPGRARETHVRVRLNWNFCQRPLSVSFKFWKLWITSVFADTVVLLRCHFITRQSSASLGGEG